MDWGYNTENGPDKWHEISDRFKDCKGLKQSPVNIDTHLTLTSSKLSLPVFNYTLQEIKLTDNGKTLIAHLNNKENHLIFNDKKYFLEQFHFHTPSEHTINAQYYPAELHLVHKHTDNDFAVVAVFFTAGKHNPELELLLETLKKKDHGKKINIERFIPRNTDIYYYAGSLTTPPCSEIVTWLVFDKAIELSTSQLQQMQSVLKNNFRPVQKLNGRKIYRLTT